MSVKTKAKPTKKVESEKDVSQDSKRERALDLYLNTDLNQKSICEIVGWTEKTFKDNKDKLGWAALKGAQTITSKSIVSKLYLKIERILDQDEDSVDADKLIKVAKSIEYLSNKKVTLSNHINCAKEFITYVYNENPDLAKKINLYQQQFITYKGSSND